MEVIRIPQVSLVDATGRRIGVYTDDPDWWQQLKLKHHNTKISHSATPAVLAVAAAQAAVANTTTSSTQQHHQLEQLNETDSPPSRQMTPVNNINTDSITNLRSRLIRETAAVGGDDDETATGGGGIVPNLTPAVAAQLVASSMNEENQKQCNVIGETPLHIAIMYDDLHTIQFLIEEKGFDVNQRSCGGRFIGGFNSKLTNSMIQQSKYEGLAYYGEYPLAFAACFASKEIYDYLIEKGADPNLQDTNGNTVLHVLVINNKLDMFQYATNHQKRKALLTIKNNQDLTPINLAAKLGRKDLFEKMLELRNIEFWRYSNITCSAYPLEGLDTVDPDGKIAWNAALSYIVNGKTEDHLDMLEIGVVKRLLEDKWSTYAQKRFFQKLVISIIHLIFLSIAVYTRAADSQNLDVWPPGSANTWVRYISELAVLIGCLAILFLQAQEIYAQGFLYYLKNLGGEPANVFYIIFCIFILIAVPFRFIYFDDAESNISNRNVEDTFVILAIPCGWVHLLFYARVATVTGPFVVMIYKMVIGDILTFSSIYSLLLFGFSSAFYYLYKNAGSSVTAMANYPEALMLSFQMTLGEFKSRLIEFDENYYSDFTKVVFVAFMILMHILLLNMLIAMMGNTYHQIIKKSEKEWRRQWAQVVILLERSFSPQDLKNYQLKYCIKLPSKDTNNKNELGLMVIKKAPKTKAFQKTACIRNWKKFCKEVMRILKEENLKSNELLDQWANKDTKMIKSKKSKKSILDWNASITSTLLEKHRPKQLLQQQQQQKRQPARLDGNVRSINTNNKFEEAQRESSIVKKPPLSSSTAGVDQQGARQKDSINSISSTVTSLSVNNTTTTTSDSSRGNSANNNNQTTSDSVKKNAAKPAADTTLATTTTATKKAAPAAVVVKNEPATTINPPSKTDYNSAPKKNSYRANVVSTKPTAQAQALIPTQPNTSSSSSSNNAITDPSDPSKANNIAAATTNVNEITQQQQPQPQSQPTVVSTLVPGVARPLYSAYDDSSSRAVTNDVTASSNNNSINNTQNQNSKAQQSTSFNDTKKNAAFTTSQNNEKSEAKSNAAASSIGKEKPNKQRPAEDDTLVGVGVNNDVEYIDLNKPLITPSSSGTSTETTTSPVNSAHPSKQQQQQPDLQRIQLNRYIHKKSFYPNQTSTIYSSLGSGNNNNTNNNSTNVDANGRALFSPDYYEHFPKQINISPVRGDFPKQDLSDIRRPVSSTLLPGSASSSNDAANHASAGAYIPRFINFTSHPPVITSNIQQQHQQQQQQQQNQLIPTSSSSSKSSPIDSVSMSLDPTTRRNSQFDDDDNDDEVGHQNESKI